MSLIANALKKNKNKKQTVIYKNKKTVQFNIQFIFLIIFIIFVIIVLLDFKLINNFYSKVKAKTFTPISELKKNKFDAISKLNKNLQSLYDDEIYINLASNEKDKALKVINDSKDYSLIGIYYFKENDIPQAKKYLSKCVNFTENPKHKVLCSYYLALLEYKLRNYSKSLDLIKSLDKNKYKNLECEIDILYATNYEKLGKYNFAKIYYDKSKNSCNIPPVNHKINIKQFLLKLKGTNNES